MADLKKLYTNCILCPRNCHADRSRSVGFCKCGDQIKAARAGLHFYEEPYLSGIQGSGTVFFTGCSLGCIYCQNGQISRENFGLEISTERLADIFLEQQGRNAHNINLVTGSHYTPTIAEALRISRDKGLDIPVVWNSSGYEKADTLKLLDGLVDIFMPDFKTLSSELGKRYMNASDYPEYAREALQCMVEMAGETVFEEYDMTSAIGTCENAAYCFDADDSLEGEGVLLKKGVVVRHLIIPGQIEDSKSVVKYLYENYGDRIWMSLMSQYTPVGEFAPGYNGSFSLNTEQYPELQRTLTQEEYDEVIDYAIDLGVENCMIQEGDTALESFIPIFDGSGILR